MNDCDDNANCSNSFGSYSCFCFNGFEGNGFNCSGMCVFLHLLVGKMLSTSLIYTNADINECDQDLDNCDINAECSNTIGSYNCTCNTGYKGTGIMSDCSK